jgi:hypothetical protein
MARIRVPIAIGLDVFIIIGVIFAVVVVVS